MSAWEKRAEDVDLQKLKPFAKKIIEKRIYHAASKSTQRKVESIIERQLEYREESARGLGHAERDKQPAATIVDELEKTYIHIHATSSIPAEAHHSQSFQLDKDNNYLKFL